MQIPARNWLTAIHLMTATKRHFPLWRCSVSWITSVIRRFGSWCTSFVLSWVSVMASINYRTQLSLTRASFPVMTCGKEAATSDAKKADSKSKGNKTPSFGSEIKAKVEIMVMGESVEKEAEKKGQKTRKAGHTR